MLLYLIHINVEYLIHINVDYLIMPLFFSAKIKAINLAEQSRNTDFIIFSDSLVSSVTT